MKKIISTLVLASFTVLYTGCPSGSSSSSSSSSSGGGGGGGGGSSGQTMAEIAQAGYACSTESALGSELSSNGMIHQLVLQSDGSFLYSVTITNGTNSTGCANSIDSNGTEIATYTVSGTYTVNGGVSASGTTATEVAFTITSADVTLQSGSDAEKTAFASWLENHCSISFNPNTTSAQSVLGATCTAITGFSAVNLPTSGEVVYNLGDNTGSVLEIGPRTNMWSPGAASYPSTLTESYGM